VHASVVEPSVVSRVATSGQRRSVRLDNDARRAQLSPGAQGRKQTLYDEVSRIDDLASEAKMTGMLYHYLPTKRDLSVAGLRRDRRGAIQAATAIFPSDRRRWSSVRAGLDAFTRSHHQHARALWR